nr:hypothetical protein [Tanacetum cinerariifolium]
TNNNLRTSSNSKNKNVDMTPRFKNDNQSRLFRNQRTVNVATAMENVGSKCMKKQVLGLKDFLSAIEITAAGYGFLMYWDDRGIVFVVLAGDSVETGGIGEQGHIGCEGEVRECLCTAQFAPILGYGDLVQGNVTINRVYYVEGLNHNLFSVGQFCVADLEVAFRKSTCFVRDLQAKATPTQAWLWHRRLSYLNFDYINLLSKIYIVIGLPKLKYVKDQLCSSCELSKAKRSSFKSKVVSSSKGRLNLLHMDLCGPMRVASINGKRYILCIMVGYSTQSKGYRVYNKRTRIIVEYIHIRFDEIKEASETSVANNTSGLVPQRQNASDYDNPVPVPQRQDVSSSADADAPSHQELDLLFGRLYDEFFNVEEGEKLQDNEFTNPFCASTQEEAESSSHNIVDKPFGKLIIRLKWLWKNKKDEDQTVIHNKARLVAKVYAQEEAFLNSPLKEEVYIAQLDEFVDPDHPDKVYRLRKALYGLKQAPRAWYDELLKFLISKGFTKDLSGHPVDQTDYRSKIGSLMYLTSSRPKIVQAGSTFELTAFLDANHAGCIDSRKSTSEGIQFLGDNLVSWMSKKQNCTVMSSAEAEYVALTASCA